MRLQLHITEDIYSKEVQQMQSILIMFHLGFFFYLLNEEYM